MSTNKTYGCSLCSERFPKAYDVVKHRKFAHPETFKCKVITPSSPLDRIHEAEKVIKDAVRDIEIEQRKLQERILELDNLQAKYKNL